MTIPAKALHDLLCELFAGDAPGLARHLSFYLDPKLASSLPGASVSLSQLAFEAQSLAQRHGILEELLASLIAVRPRRESAIIEVATALGFNLAAPSGGLLQPMQPPQLPRAQTDSPLPPPSRTTQAPPAAAPQAALAPYTTTTNTANTATWDVFISYARAEIEWVELLAENLHRLGLSVFFDEWEIGAGDVVNHRIDAGLGGSRAGIIVASDTALARLFVAEEHAALLSKAVRDGQRLVPVLYNLKSERALPPSLSNRRWVDFRDCDETSYIARVTELAQALRGTRRGPPPRDGIIRPPDTLSTHKNPAGAPRARRHPTTTSAKSPEEAPADTTQTAAPHHPAGTRSYRSSLTPPGRGLTWLHLSDLHITDGDAYDSDLVLEGVVELVRREVGERSPDFIVVTGDLASTGKASEYARATEFFTDLLSAAGLRETPERLVVVPGNHDVDRRALRGLARTITNESESQEYFSKDHPRPHFVGQQAFREWHDTFFSSTGRRAAKDTTCGPIVRLATPGGTVAILPINTALFARGDDDHGRLWIGRRALRRAAKDLEAEPAELKIAAMHHPSDWLADAERGPIRRALHETVNVLLTGHLHDPSSAQVTTSASQVLHVAAGATYQGSQYPCRLFFACLRENAIRLRPYGYADTIERWVVDPAVFPDAHDFEGVFARA